MPNLCAVMGVHLAICVVCAVAMDDDLSFSPLDTRSDGAPSSQDSERHYREKGYFPLQGATESARLGPAVFVVTRDLVIGTNVDVRFSAGSRVYCERGVRIRVKGQLIALGNTNEPVVFAPLPTGEYPFPVAGADSLWNGIVVEDSATLYLESARVVGCVSGIDVLAGDNSVRLRNTVFTNTGQCRLRVEGRDVAVAEGEPVTWLWPEAEQKGGITHAGDAASGEAQWRLPSRIGFAVTAAGGAALALVSELLVRKYADDFSNETMYPSRADKLHDKAQRAARMRTVGIVAGCVGAVGFTVTFFF